MLAITLSCVVATMTFLNIITIATHGIDFEVPDEGDFSWAIDPVERRFLLLTNFTVSNHGSYDINDIDIEARLLVDNDTELIKFSEGDLAVTRGSDKKFDIIVSIELDEIDIAGWFDLLYKDTMLKLVLDIDIDYMFRLIHVTVDETIEYPWTAPLSSYLDGNLALPSIGYALDLAVDGFGYGLGLVERQILSMAIEHGDFEYSDADGYAVAVNSTLISEDVHELACGIRIPIDAYDSALEVSFVLEIGLTASDAWVNVLEVNISYGQH